MIPVSHEYKKNPDRSRAGPEKCCYRQKDKPTTRKKINCIKTLAADDPEILRTTKNINNLKIMTQW
jgi:hypothetical protein